MTYIAAIVNHVKHYETPIPDKYFVLHIESYIFFISSTRWQKIFMSSGVLFIYFFWHMIVRSSTEVRDLALDVFSVSVRWRLQNIPLIFLLQKLRYCMTDLSY